ncbi:hypothetical protein EMCRGX_G029108 [Ephydatia muelleri]
MFNVEQDTIWLKSRYKDGHVYFPNPDGVFDLLNDGVLPHAELIVEGEPRQGQASQPSCSGIYAQPSRSSAIVMDSTPPRYSPGSQFTSVTAHRGKRPLEEATYRLKIIQATMAFASPGNKKPTFECHGQAFFEITESNANVPALLVAVRTEFGEDYTIVTGDGLEVIWHTRFEVLETSNCCKQLLGCDACIKTWYQDSPTTKNCPGCNKERGFPETMRLHGLDELLLATKDLVDDILDDAISVDSD